MKKILVLILALVMMLSLTACGGEKIEITTDNWQDYLEIKQVFVLEKRNPGDVPSDPLAFNYTFLGLKDEYADKVVSDETELTVNYSAMERYYKFSVEDGQIIKGEFATERIPFSYVDAIAGNYNLAFSRETDDMLENEYKRVVQFSSSGNFDEVGILEDIEIEKIEGTLVLE